MIGKNVKLSNLCRKNLTEKNSIMEKYSIEPYREEESQARDFRKEEAYLRAKKRVEAISGFYWHLASYVVVNAFLIILIAMNSGSGFRGFGPYARSAATRTSYTSLITLGHWPRSSRPGASATISPAWQSSHCCSGHP